jgi:hypothetical protein
VTALNKDQKAAITRRLKRPRTERNERERARRRRQRDELGLPRLHIVQASSLSRVPDAVLADREARYAAHAAADPAQLLFGDPPPGFSALDRRGA